MSSITRAPANASPFRRPWMGFLAIALICCLAGCEEVDDQSKTPPEALALVNPTPIGDGFAAANKRHRILMAVIDSGTDYNHPLLRDNIHFTLNEAGAPIGLGYDFIGQDTWPSPYVARTADINPEVRLFERKGAALARARLKKVQEHLPHLSSFFEPERRIEQEIEGVFHGTHVAGLMVYDEPRLGLLAYRVLPTNVVFRNGEVISKEDKRETVFGNIVAAMKMAIASGVRVINLSLALEAKKDESEQSPNSEYQWLKRRMAEIEDIAIRNPHVAIVAAAGNSSTWIDEKTNIQLPCGVKSPNLLCVGALGKNENLASFSNILLTQAPFIAAPGVDILSLSPTKICDSKALRTISSGEDDNHWDMPLTLRSIYESIRKDCESTVGMKRSSGTSMASPIVARAIGKILLENPRLSGAQAISRLMARGQRVNMGPLKLTRIRMEHPSWYPALTSQKKGQARGGLKPSSVTPIKSGPIEASESFEFFIPESFEI